MEIKPGSKEPIFDAETGAQIADEIGYPVIVKAALGGGAHKVSSMT